ncbi:hypothetical protein NL676_024277 [Syzygium grande]|nr:hypothetical protein NL676_024277 [Syzygium grande]
MAKVLSLLHLLFHFLIFQNLLFYAHSTRRGFSLKLIPRFSPKSPLYPGDLTWEEKLDMAVELSVSRAHYINALSNKSSSEDPNNIHLKVHEDSHFYAVELQLRTPATTQVRPMDTGSGLTWTQCQPCKNCFRQKIPIYTPDSSSSFQKLPCDHWLCRSRFQCIRGQCVYWACFNPPGSHIRVLVG